MDKITRAYRLNYYDDCDDHPMVINAYRAYQARFGQDLEFDPREKSLSEKSFQKLCNLYFCLSLSEGNSHAVHPGPLQITIIITHFSQPTFDDYDHHNHNHYHRHYYRHHYDHDYHDHDNQIHFSPTTFDQLELDVRVTIGQMNILTFMQVLPLLRVALIVALPLILTSLRIISS